MLSWKFLQLLFQIRRWVERMNRTSRSTNGKRRTRTTLNIDRLEYYLQNAWSKLNSNRGTNRQYKNVLKQYEKKFGNQKLVTLLPKALEKNIDESFCRRTVELCRIYLLAISISFYIFPEFQQRFQQKIKIRPFIDRYRFNLNNFILEDEYFYSGFWFHLW